MSAVRLNSFAFAFLLLVLSVNLLGCSFAGRMKFLSKAAGDTSLQALSITSFPTQMYAGQTLQVQVSGGVAPYTYSTHSSEGKIDSTGLYTASSFLGPTSSVRVTDSSSRTFDTASPTVVSKTAWIGRMGSLPTGGDPSCLTSVTLNSFTPGWCFGGTADKTTLPESLAVDVTQDSKGNIYVTSQKNHFVSKFDSSGKYLGWIGGINTTQKTSGWTIGGTATQGLGDGQFNQPVGLYVDSSDNLYIVDGNPSRVQKFNATTGAFIGWLGWVGGSSATCNGSIRNSEFSNGWCQGGISSSTTSYGGLNKPTYITGDSNGFLYVSDTNSGRISRYDAATGAARGWIGQIATSGACGTVGTFTTTWCETPGITSQNSASSNQDGSLQNPHGLTVSGGFLYVANTGASTIVRYDLTNGSYQGWIGRIYLASATSGWTMSGTPTGDTGDGSFLSPNGISHDSAGNLYVADTGNHRVIKVNSSGYTLGWFGGSAAPNFPTGGEAGCGQAGSGVGWCTGGRGALGSGDGMMDTPTGIHYSPFGYLLIADNKNHRVLRLGQ